MATDLLDFMLRPSYPFVDLAPRSNDSILEFNAFLLLMVSNLFYMYLQLNMDVNINSFKFREWNSRHALF